MFHQQQCLRWRFWPVELTLSQLRVRTQRYSDGCAKALPVKWFGRVRRYQGGLRPAYVHKLSAALGAMDCLRLCKYACWQFDHEGTVHGRDYRGQAFGFTSLEGLVECLTMLEQTPSRACQN